MGRFPQRRCEKGSQRWLQTCVNERPDLLDASIGAGRINWVSPLAADTM
jgi:hypothetical protein